MSERVVVSSGKERRKPWRGPEEGGDHETPVRRGDVMAWGQRSGTDRRVADRYSMRGWLQAHIDEADAHGMDAPVVREIIERLRCGGEDHRGQVRLLVQQSRDGYANGYYAGRRSAIKSVSWFNSERERLKAKLRDNGIEP